MTRHFGQFLLCVLLLVGGAFAWGAEMYVLCGVLLFAGGLWTIGIFSGGLWEYHNDEISNRELLVRARTTFAATISATDEETRHFLAHEWPEMGVEFGEEALTYILKDGVNTQVLLPFMRAFLIDSTEQAFVDIRNYNDVKYLQQRFQVSRDVVRTQWNLLTDLLVKEGYLIAGSMSGNQTYRWTSADHFKKLRRRWLNVHGVTKLES